MTRYHDKLAAKVPTVGKPWDEEWKPGVIAKNEPAKTADYSGLSDAELVAKLDEFTDHMRYQWWIHGHINFVLLSSSAFCDMYDKVMQPDRDDRVVPDAAGLPHPLGRRAAGACGSSAAMCKTSPALRELFDADARRARSSAELDKTDDGRAFRSQARRVPRSSSAGAATPCTTSPTSRGGRTRRSRCRASPASSTSTTAEDPELLYQTAVDAARGAAGQGPGQAGRRSRRSSRSSTSCTRPPATASRSPRTTRSTSTSSASACSAGSRSPSATASWRRASSTRPTTCSSSAGDEVPDALLNGGDRRADVASRRATFDGRRQGRRRPAPSARRPDPRRRAARPVHGRARLPPARHGAARGEPRPEHASGRGRLAGRATRGTARVVRSLAEAQDTSRRARSWCAR